ncbi:MAG: response regulator [Planctomycetes bacterium]|nr:response regulator [Planctomycetota bacterium]
MTSRAKQHIFVVDDEPNLLKLVGIILEQTGLKVTCFAHAADCLEQLRLQTCDLLITDVKMPGIDGIELLKEAKCLVPSLPVIVMTGYADISMAIEVLTLGAAQFIEKPFAMGNFLQIVKKVMKQSPIHCPILDESLTKKEMKVLHLILECKSTKEIAQIMHLSLRTITNYRSRVMHKLGVDNVVNLVKQAAVMGLLESSSNGRSSRKRQIDLLEFGKMITGIRHDLVSALGVISTTTYLLRDYVHEPERVDDLKRITLATRYCGLVLGNLSDLVARTRPNKVSLDVTELLDEVTEIVASRIRPGIDLRKNYESNIPHVRADRGQIQRVFMNLIDNALQAIPDDGKLSISVEHEYSTRYSQSKRNIVVKVSDTGRGIPKKNQKKIFHLAFSTKRQGYGIGLYVAKQILEQHKGSIQVKSQEQKGSTFIARLPAEKSK